MSPFEIAAQLREIAAYRGLDGDVHRARAFERAAHSVEQVHDLDRMIAEQRTTELPGVGAAIAGVIHELAAGGTSALLEQLRARWPRPIVELSLLPKIGPLRARLIHEALAPASLDEVAAMCEVGRVRALPRFGKVSEARLLTAIRERDQREERWLLSDARDRSAAIAAHLRACPAAQRVEIAGPARRWLEIVDRLAFAVATDDPDAVSAHLGRLPLVAALAPLEAGGVIVARLASGLALELHTAPPARFGLAWIRATGAAEHLAGLERLARERALSLDALDDLDAPDEAAVYRALGLPWLPPEVRDGTDEILAALAGDDFADLLTLADVTGAVHCHTTYSDGKATIEDMARAAQERGLGFITITDHSAQAHYASGVSAEGLREQWREIDRVQPAVACRILRGTEADILADGSLDVDDDALDHLDVVIASLHQRHRMDEDAMTQRLVTALRQPVFKIWGHALGRMLLRREPIACRFDEILDAIGDGATTAIELNGDPHRLDLAPEHARLAQARGIRFVVSSDAHSPRALACLEYAVAMARRARLRPRDVLNTLPADELARAVRPRARAQPTSRGRWGLACRGSPQLTAN